LKQSAHRHGKLGHGLLRRATLSVLLLVAAYALLAYLALPMLWTHYEHQKRLARCRC
jgi:hypothetical protein